MRVRRRIWLGSLVLAIVIVAVTLSGVPSRLVEAAVVLTDVASGNAPSWLKSARPEPLRLSRAVRAGGRHFLVDLYRPGGDAPPRGALLLINGVAPRGKDDPRLVAFARSLARARFLVVVPDIANLRRMRVLPSDVDQIEATVAYVALNAKKLGVSRIGIAAVSYGVGPAVLAASRPSIRHKVGFIIGVGGYYDMTASVRYFTTGYFRAPGAPPGSRWRYLKPDNRLKWLFLYNNADYASAVEDRQALRRVARSKFLNAGLSVRAIMSRVGADARALYEICANTDPDAVGRLLARLPARMRKVAAAMDLSTKNLSGLRARLFLIHGRDDRIVPPGESLKLAAAARSSVSNVFLVDSLFHADLRPMGLRDKLTLWRALYMILLARDG